MAGTLEEDGSLDPAAAPIILCVGRKGSGKSVMGLLYAATWPYDMVVIDVAGDDGPVARTGLGTHDVFDVRGRVDELPRAWPEDLRREQRPMILRYLPDAGSPTELEDMDAMVGLAFHQSNNPRPAMLLVHEIGRVAPANRTPAHMRRVLNHSRHEKLTAVFCGPRPKTVDPLVVQQADLVYTFELNSAGDRLRISENIGWDSRDFDAAVGELGPHEYLLFDARVPKPEPGDKDLRLVHADALPQDVVDQVKRWAQAGNGRGVDTPSPARRAAAARSR